MMKEKLHKTGELQPQLFPTILSLGFIIFVSLCCFTSYMINTENKLHQLTERMEALESALTQLTAELEVVHEVFYEAQKIKDHIKQRSKISSEQATEVTYALLHCSYQNKLNPFFTAGHRRDRIQFLPACRRGRRRARIGPSTLRHFQNDDERRRFL